MLVIDGKIVTFCCCVKFEKENVTHGFTKQLD
jgi:hypothetical protein